MGAIKRTPADKWFSDCIRERAEWRCERCGTQYHPPTKALHCSHFHGRGNWSVRFDPDNAAAHCMGCHLWFEGRPAEHQSWMRDRLGETRMDELQARANDARIGRQARKQVKAIAAHYRAEHARMMALRGAGFTGYMEFVGYELAIRRLGSALHGRTGQGAYGAVCALLPRLGLPHG